VCQSLIFISAAVREDNCFLQGSFRDPWFSLAIQFKRWNW